MRSNKTEDLNWHPFYLITRINESRTLTKYISWKCESKFDGRKCNLNQKWNNGVCWCECKIFKENRVYKKGYFWNTVICSCKNGKYSGSINGDSVAICDVTKT